MRGRLRAPWRAHAAPGLAVLLSGIVAVAAALAADAADLLAGPEQNTIGLRFQLRGVQPVDDVAVVAIDDVTLSDLRQQWPFPRTLHARAIDRLRRAGARVIAYDVQFTEETKPREDLALYDAVARAPGTVLATTETDGRGGTSILGGAENLRAAGALAGAANVNADLGGVVERFRFSEGGLRTFGVVTGQRAGGPRLTASSFPAEGAWIDFRGPPGTIPAISFSDLVRGRADSGSLRDRVVVVGVTAPTLQDVHPTPASSEEVMSGAEVQANAIWTALHGLPLRSAPGWVGWLAILAAGLTPALAARRGRALRAALVALGLALGWLLAVQAAFGQGLILPVSYPMMALLLGTLSAITTAYVAERDERRRAALYGARLETEVSARTDQLRQTQLEIVSRLGRAVESRDVGTGAHVARMSTLSHRLALAIGTAAPDAETLRQAAMLHDVGKVGVPDRLLLKPGPFGGEERILMQRHTLIGAEILDGSRSPLIQLAAEIARSHHERWDGTGYPDGLRGEQIPLAARVCAICDVFDALRSARPYKPAWPLPETLAKIKSERGKHFDPQLVDAFLAILPKLEPELLAPATVPNHQTSQIGVATTRLDQPPDPPHAHRNASEPDLACPAHTEPLAG